MEVLICCGLSPSDEDETAKLLIDCGARLNSTNNKGATPLIIAAVSGHHSVLRLLANNPQTNLHAQVCSTALQWLDMHTCRPSCEQTVRPKVMNSTICSSLNESCPALPTSVHEVPWDAIDTCMFTIGPLSHNPYSQPRLSPDPWTAIGNTGHLRGDKSD